MPVTAVNSLLPSQLQGLTTTQLSQIMNSANFASFSSAVQSYAVSASNPTKTTSVVVSINSNGNSTVKTNAGVHQSNMKLTSLLISIGLSSIYMYLF